MQLIESKSLLAKLMATENLTVEQRPVQTASFDVQNRILTVPILDKNISGVIYDLFMGHEVGHALYTPMEGMLKVRNLKLNSDVANVVEDSRIERKIKYKYPGLKNSFVKAYQELMDKDFFGVKGSDLDKLNFLDRINLHCKGGAALRIQFNDIERGLVQEVETTETYDDVIEVTKKIIDYMKMQFEEEEKQKIKVLVMDESGDDDSEDGEDDKSVEENFDSDLEFELGDDSTGLKPKEDTGEGKTINASGSAPEKSMEEKIEEKIKSHTDEAFRKNEKKLFESKPGTYAYANIPQLDTKYIFDHKDLWKKYKDEGYCTCPESYVKIRNESNKVVSYLVKEFEMRKNADQLKRASVAKTGDLNMKKIFSYQFNEDIFKKITVVPGGKSHGLVMFLDWSGSMVEHIGNTVKQLINLVLFCKKVNIPYEVYCFVEDTDNQYRVKQQIIKGDLRLRSFGLCNLLSSRMNSAEFTYAASALMYMAGLSKNMNRPGVTPYWLSLAGTPLNEAIIYSMSIVPEFQKRNKLQIVNTIFLTDGEGHALREVFDVTDNRYVMGKQIKAETLVIRDPITKNQESMDLKAFYEEQSKALIKLLKARTNSNVIGFYVINGRDFGRRVVQWFPKQNNHEEIKAEFRKNKFMVLENSGYDEYYILRSGALDTEEDSTFEVKDNSTIRGIASAFAKHNGNRIGSRVVLNRFIKLVA